MFAFAVAKLFALNVLDAYVNPALPPNTLSEVNTSCVSVKPVSLMLVKLPRVASTLPSVLTVKLPPAALILDAIFAYPFAVKSPLVPTLKLALYDIPMLLTVKSFPLAVKLTAPDVATTLTPVVPVNLPVPVISILELLPSILTLLTVTIFPVLSNVNPPVAFDIPPSLNTTFVSKPGALVEPLIAP